MTDDLRKLADELSANLACCEQWERDTILSALQSVQLAEREKALEECAVAANSWGVSCNNEHESQHFYCLRDTFRALKTNSPQASGESHAQTASLNRQDRPEGRFGYGEALHTIRHCALSGGSLSDVVEIVDKALGETL